MTRKVKPLAVCFFVFAAIVVSIILIIASNGEPAYAENGNAHDYKINSGVYYLNGNPDSCYFNIDDDKLQLVITEDTDMQELFDEMCSMNAAFAQVFVFEDWCADEKEYWQNPKEFMINVLPYGVQLGWDIYYSEIDGSMSSYVCADYVNEDSFKYNMCTFTRVTEK